MTARPTHHRNNVFQRLQHSMAGNGVPLRDQADHLADVAFLDFMDTFCSPIGNHIPAEQARNSYMLLNEGFNQIVDPVDDKTATRLFLFLSRISPIQPGGEDLLSLRPCHRQGDPTVRTDRIFAKPRARAQERYITRKTLRPLGVTFTPKPGNPASQ